MCSMQNVIKSSPNRRKSPVEAYANRPIYFIKCMKVFLEDKCVCVTDYIWNHRIRLILTSWTNLKNSAARVILMPPVHWDVLVG